MRAWTPWLLMTLWYSSGYATALSPQDFASGMTVVVSREAPVYRVTVPLAVYQGTVREDLGDLRVFNAQGEAVPYSLSHYAPPPRASAEIADRPAVVYASLDAGGTREAADSRAYTFDLGAHVPASRVNLTLPEGNSFDRVEVSSRRTSTDTWHTRTIAEVYRIVTPDGERSNAPAMVNEARDRYWRVRILQGGDLLGTPPRLVVSYVPAEVTFLAQGHGPFVLAYGSVSALPGETDLTQVSANADVVAATVDATETLGGPSRRVSSPAAFPWMRAVLWGVLILAALLLGWMALRLSKDADA